MENGSWKEMLFKSAKLPALFFLSAVLIGLTPVAVAIPERWLRFTALSSKLLAAVATAVLAQKFLLILHRRYFYGKETLKTYSGITRVLISVGVYAVLALIFLDTAGVSITPLIASLGVGSVAVALALQDTLSSVFSGIYIVVDQPVRVGDFVRLESGEEGTVEAIGWRSVRIRRLPNDIVIIPNAKLAGSIIANYSLPDKEVAVPVPVGVDYSSDLEKVERVSIEVARDVMKTVPGGVRDFEPVVRYQTFGESSIDFAVVMRAKEFVDQYLIKHEFVKKLHARYLKEGINIPFPVRTVYLKKEG